jgi:hypothetical protein
MKFILPLLFLVSCSSLMRPTYNYASLKHDPQKKVVVEEVDKYVDKFVLEVCNNKVNDECKKSFLTMLHSRLSNKYEGASQKAIESTCASNPVECQKPNFLEHIYIVIHNRTVDQFQVFNEKWGEDDLETEWRRFLAPPSSRVVEHYNNYPQPLYQQPVYQNPQMQRQPSHCESRAYGGTVFTDCR